MPLQGWEEPAPPPRVNTGIRLPVALYRKMQAEAKRRGISVNRLVEWVMESWFAGKNG